MVNLDSLIRSNKVISQTFTKGIIGVFVGGTSGVGEYTLRVLSKYVPNSKFYIVGRSQEAADKIITECVQETPTNSFSFIKADIGDMKNVDDVCKQIKDKEPAINLLFQSQGTMGFNRG